MGLTVSSANPPTPSGQALTMTIKTRLLDDWPYSARGAYPYLPQKMLTLLRVIDTLCFPVKIRLSQSLWHRRGVSLAPPAALVLLLFFLSSSSWSQGLESEPNDSPAEADPLSIGSAISATTLRPAWFGHGDSAVCRRRADGGGL